MKSDNEDHFFELVIERCKRQLDLCALAFNLIQSAHWSDYERVNVISAGYQGISRMKSLGVAMEDVYRHMVNTGMDEDNASEMVDLAYNHFIDKSPSELRECVHTQIDKNSTMLGHSACVHAHLRRIYVLGRHKPSWKGLNK